MTVLMLEPAEPTSVSCRSCGACCSFSTEWPLFSLESELSLSQIPRTYVDDERGRMRCNGNRCAALRRRRRRFDGVRDLRRETRCLQSVFAWRWRLPNGKGAL